MPLAEYKLHMVVEGATTPPFIFDGGQWYNPTDHTMVGWIDDESKRNYYIPDTIVTLTREEFVQRILGIHAVKPYPVDDPMGDQQDQTPKTDAQVAEDAGIWYDKFFETHDPYTHW